jgi:hypothetical protein
VTVRTARVILACTALLAAVVVALGAQQLTAARSRARSAQTALDQIARDAQEVLELLGRVQHVELRQRPQQDVIAQVNTVLAEVGIPSRSLRSLSPEADSQIVSGKDTTNAKLNRQSLRLVLENLTVPEIGAFLLKWRSSQQIWTVTRIELAHSGGRGQDGNEDHYDGTLVISALYVEDLPATNAAGDSPSPNQPRT